MPNPTGKGHCRENGRIVSRFDRLTDLIHYQVSLGSDVLLDARDAITLLEGVERLRNRLEARLARKTYKSDKRRARFIMQTVADEHGYSVAELRGNRRNLAISHARHDAIRRITDECPNLTSPDIAGLFNMNHTAVLYVQGRLSRRQPPALREAA